MPDPIVAMWDAILPPGGGSEHVHWVKIGDHLTRITVITKRMVAYGDGSEKVRTTLRINSEEIEE